MIKKSLVTLHIIILSLLSTNALSQTYTEDSIAVKAILDSNELYDITVEEVTDTSDGRIVVLDLTSKGVNTIPLEIGKLGNMKDLELGFNNLTTLPKEIWNLTNLVELDLNDNNINNIPYEIGYLVNLKILDLDYNNINTIPAEICDIINLESLDISDNIITSIPSNIGNLINLANLDISYNNLDSLPEEICMLNNLDQLNLRHNNLTDLPDSIVNLVLYDPEVQVRLNVDYNKLCSLSVDVKKWVDTYSDNRDWEETQECDISIISKYKNKNNDYKILFNPGNCSIKLDIFKSGYVKFEVLDLKGRSIETLIDFYKQEGKYNISLNNYKYSSGIYYFKLTINNKTFIKKAVVIR